MKHCIKMLSKLGCLDSLVNAIFIGGATQFKDDFNTDLSKVISGRVINCFSKDDIILHRLYSIVIPVEPTGRTPNQNIVMENLEFKLWHTNYRKNFEMVRDKLNIEFV